MAEHSHQPCIFCDSSDAFSYNDVSGMFKCFSCDATSGTEKGKCYDGKTFEPFDYGSNPPTDEEVSYDPYIPDEYRGIKKSTFEGDNLCFFNETDKGILINFIYPNAVKFRRTWLPKEDRYHFGAQGSLDRLQGIDIDPPKGKFITITEGELDRYSVKQMMGDFPVYNAPSAGPSREFWKNTREDLKDYEGKIILSVDNDERGDELADKFYNMFPGRVLRVEHGKYKDANEFLEDGAKAEYKRAWWSAKLLKPENIRITEDDFIKLYNDTPDYEYFPTGIAELDDRILGIHKGVFTLIVAPTGVGKTEFMRYLEWQALSKTDYTIAFCHIEEPDLRSILGLVSYELNEDVTRKDLVAKKDMEQKVMDSIKRLSADGRMIEFSYNTTSKPQDLIDQIRFLRTGLGVDYVFFEPIQDIVNGDLNTKESVLTDLSNQMKLLAPEINVGIVVIAHANEDGDPKYCKSIVQSAAFEIVLDRDLDAEDEDDIDLTRVRVGRKNRTGGGSGSAGAYRFSHDSYTIRPVNSTEIVKIDSDKVVGF